MKIYTAASREYRDDRTNEQGGTQRDLASPTTSGEHRTKHGRGGGRGGGAEGVFILAETPVWNGTGGGNGTAGDI